MAGETNADSRRNLTVEPPPPPIPKDMQGSDNPIPLSPQWLLPKLGDNKLGIESHFSPHHGNHLDAGKVSGNGENFSDMEKKSVFRPSVYDSESGRRDRWRDEERETNTSVRRDRWREVDKELGDTLKIERWTDNLSRHAGDTRRLPSERWTDSGNRESNYDQRRESKWNTRWGPDDKESESWREKWSDSTRDSEGSNDKVISHVVSYGRDTTNHGKDIDREGDHNSRSWRSNSSLTRGRGEASHYQMQSNKQSPMFSYGRGRGENGPSVFSAGRGRVNPNTSTVNTGASRSYPLGASSDKSVGPRGDLYTLRYSRMKLLDIYRMTDLSSHRISLKEFVEVPSLTLQESLDPLALSAPSSEELVILNGIDKGDIVSSGMSQAPKDGSVGRTSVDAVASMQTKLGSREDSSFVVDDYKDEIVNKTKVDPFSHLESLSNEKHLLQHGAYPMTALNQNLHHHQENTEAPLHEGTIKKADEFSARNSGILEHPSMNYHVPLRSQSLGEHYRGSFHDWKDFSAEDRSKTYDMGWPHLQKDPENEQKNHSVCTPYIRDESRGQNNDDFDPGFRSDYMMKRQSSERLGQEREGNALHGQEDPFMSNKDKSASRKFQSPEELSLYYRDPQGQIQGPFSGSDLIGWFESGYFGIDLQVRLASAPSDAPFVLLGDVMPHLHMKARPPPGFGVARPNDMMEVSSGTKVTPCNIHPGTSDIEVFKNGNGKRHDTATEAENRFLESLMSGKMSTSTSKHFSVAEGIQGCGRISAGNMPVGESRSDLNHLLAQRMSLDRQRSMPNHHPYWPGGDASSISSKNDIIPDSPVQQHSKLLPTMGDTRPIPLSPQPVDLLSILHAAAEKSPSPVINSGVPGWSNFPEVRPLNPNVHVGLDIVRDNVDLHQNQHFSPQAGFGVQQQRLQQQNEPSLSHLIAQHGDFSSSLVPPEKYTTSEIPQDPQTLSLLQQQYLLSQLHLHPQAVPTQLSLMDRLLLLKQQQQKHEQQQHQLFLQQQQLLFSQVLPVHQSHPHFGDASYGLLKAALPVGNTSVDHLGLQQIPEALQINQQVKVSNLHAGLASAPPDLHLQAPHDVSHIAGSGPSALHMRQPVFDHSVPATVSQDATVLQDAANSSSFDLATTSATQGGSFLCEATENSLVACVLQKDIQAMDGNATQQNFPVLSQTSANTTSITLEATNSLKISEEGSGTTDFASSVVEQIHDIKTSLDGIPDRDQVELPSVKVVKSVEGREIKKVSDKKSKKQKNLRTVSTTDTSKGSVKSATCQPLKQDAELDRTKFGLTNSEGNVDTENSMYGSSALRIGAEQSSNNGDANLGAQQTQLSSSLDIAVGEGRIVEGKSEQEEVGTFPNMHTISGHHRTWKSALGLKGKAKSLLEIQQEEQRKAQTEIKVSETTTLISPASSQPTPWVGVLANVDHKSSKGVVQGAISMQVVNSQSSKSQLHDVLAEEVLAKLNVGATEAPATDEKGLPMPLVPQTGAQVDVMVCSDDDFVEAKDTKKSRKKAAKAKAAGLKASLPVASIDLSAALIPLEKGKNARQAQVEKEPLPVPPAGPSLGDFVLWKGDQENSTPAPAAWSTELGNLHKPTSLRDIQKEQEKRTSSVQKQIPIPTPAKAQTNKGSRGNGSSLLVSSSSPLNAISTIQTKAVSPVQDSTVNSSQLKFRTEDDLFWGPLDQSKQETKGLDFPSLVNPNSWGVKGNTAKGAAVGSSSRQKRLNTRSSDYSSASSPVTGHAISKGRMNAATKHSEAMDFREWCENELARITGTKDMNFLEYCMKQPTSEAEMLLKENLGSLDRNHEFIDKFLDYKDFLSPEVIEMAFKAPGGHKVIEDGLGYRPSSDARQTKNVDGDTDWDLDGSAKGGKKKVKKGKKVMPSAVLGFNVVSNRIMMGEIQSVDE